MQKISAMNQNNQTLEIDVIRYFTKDDKKYLIFTLNEKDAQGYINVYVSKVVTLNGIISAYGIIDESEWNQVKDLIKTIIKENREGNPLQLEELPVAELNQIKITGQQLFKLSGNPVELLGSSKEPEVSEPVEMKNGEVPVKEEQTVSLDPEFLIKYQQLVEENTKLKTQLESIKAIIEK